MPSSQSLNVFLSLLARARVHLDLIEHGAKHYSTVPPPLRGSEYDPINVATSLGTTLLVATVEQYFKSLFVALLKYHPRKESVLAKYRIGPQELAMVSSGDVSVEEALARNLSFQNINRTGIYFRDLDAKLDLLAPLKRPYRRRKESLYNTFARLVSHRHEMIHRYATTPGYDLASGKKDIDSVEVGMKRIHLNVSKHYGWSNQIEW